MRLTVQLGAAKSGEVRRKLVAAEGVGWENAMVTHHCGLPSTGKELECSKMRGKEEGAPLDFQPCLILDSLNLAGISSTPGCSDL